MKLSLYYKLGVSQHELDFVDINPDRDTRLFVDPHFLAQRQDPFSIAATNTVRNFFSHFLELVRDKDFDRARGLFDYLHEPNETCLGLSKGAPRGNAVSSKLAADLFESLKRSRAIKSGLIEHIEDVRLFINGVDKDKTSDIVTNIIRRHLLFYTRKQCRIWGLPLTPGRDSGFFWDAASHDWNSELGEMLVHDGRHILLVPKGIVSYSKAYSASRLHRYAVLPYLQHQHLKMNTVFVQHRTLKSGKKTMIVTKESLVRSGEAPADKDFLTTFTEKHKKVFEVFQASVAVGMKSLPAGDFQAGVSPTETASQLITALGSISSGPKEATVFHRWCAGALELILYPDLICPNIETPRDGGRKRVDITFENAACEGFFKRLHQSQNLPCSYIFIECKNYSTDPSNPEVDQLNGRFGTNVGRVGLLIARNVTNKGLLIARCQDIFRNVGNLIVPLWDDDMISMLRLVSDVGSRAYEDLLTERARSIRLG